MAKRTQYIAAESLKDCTRYVIEYDNPDSRGGVARTMGFYRYGCFFVDGEDYGDRFPPAAEDSIYRAVREIDLWAA